MEQLEHTAWNNNTHMEKKVLSAVQQTKW